MPTKSERLPAPNQDEFNRKIASLDEKISVLQTKREALIKTVREKREGGRVDNADMSAKNFVGERIAKKKEANAEKRNLMAEQDDLKLEISREIDSIRNIKGKIKLFDANDIEPEIKRLSRQQETSSLSLQEEKKIVNQIRDLEASKPYVEEYHQRNLRVDQYKARRDEIRARIGILRQQVEQYNKEIDEVQSKVKDSRDKLNTEIPDLEDKIEALKEEIQKVRESKRESTKAFDDAKYNYEKQQKLIKHIEFVTKKKQEILEREEKRKQWEDRRKEEELNKPEPWFFQKKQCDNYISFLQKLIPTEDASGAEKVTPQEANILASKEDRLKADTASYFGPSTGKGKKKKERVRKNAKTTENALLNLPLDLLRFLTTTSIKAPYTLAEVPACIDSIKKQREWYETNPESEQEPQKPQTERAPVQEERKTTTTSTIKPEDFPKPETSKVAESYGIFQVELPQRPVKKEERGGRRGRRGGK
eukprot:CAMPEP_0204919626 /NCGR_PEP_ID=MMETSP1397-20131031/16924_1 /ASSEMBLY_ACC=CAM_ASM_000891 /TAXON_ID=49980 /ORGANISM="Climacostomum Climacostomum virens, Strain Stock W-24" /LENGTH=477 /DNA_ID=CAMNT_0052093233 /DNA_START=401 /DNA_END=1834 /DNA_ORIENTATION=+